MSSVSNPEYRAMKLSKPPENLAKSVAVRVNQNQNGGSAVRSAKPRGPRPMPDAIFSGLTARQKLHSDAKASRSEFLSEKQTTLSMLKRAGLKVKPKAVADANIEAVASALVSGGAPQRRGTDAMTAAQTAIELLLGRGQRVAPEEIEKANRNALNAAKILSTRTVTPLVWLLRCERLTRIIHFSVVVL
jgi:hypothetical protein